MDFETIHVQILHYDICQIYACEIQTNSLVHDLV